MWRLPAAAAGRCPPAAISAPQADDRAEPLTLLFAPRRVHPPKGLPRPGAGNLRAKAVIKKTLSSKGLLLHELGGDLGTLHGGLSESADGTEQLLLETSSHCPNKMSKCSRGVGEGGVKHVEECPAGAPTHPAGAGRRLFPLCPPLALAA